MLYSTSNRYGGMAIALHWLIALGVVVLYPLGLYMTGLDYGHPWYYSAPALHKSLGVLLFGLIVLRLIWTRFDTRPPPLATHSPIERRLALGMRWALHLLLILIPLSGYMIATADGKPVDVFGWFQVPALIYGLPNQEDIAGEVHEILAHILIVLAGLHALAALKHHLIDHDETLRRMSFMPSRIHSKQEGEQP